MSVLKFPLKRKVSADPYEEFTACAECDSENPIGKTRGGEDPLFVCPDCGTVEGNTKRLLLNTETGEVSPLCKVVGNMCRDYLGPLETSCPKCLFPAFND